MAGPPGMAGSYVALGDSISIDDYAGGPGRGAASLLYANRDDDFPEWRGRDLRSAGVTAVHVLARDGATTADVLTGQLARLRELRSPPAVLTITMGGNDLLISFGDDDAAEHACAAVRARGEAVLARLRESFGDVTIVISTVYDPTDGTGDGSLAGLPAWDSGLAWLDRLNGHIRDLAGRYDAVIADVHAAFLGHGVLAGDPAQPEPRPAERDLWYCGAVEPNAWGASAVRGAWWDALALGSARRPRSTGGAYA